MLVNVVDSVLPSSLFFRYVSIGDIARPGCHPPNVAAIYHNCDKLFASPVGYDLVRHPSYTKAMFIFTINCLPTYVIVLTCFIWFNLQESIHLMFVFLHSSKVLSCLIILSIITTDDQF